MTFRWEFSKDFLKEAALFKLNLEVRVKLGWGLEVGGWGRRSSKDREGFSSCTVVIRLHGMYLQLFYWFCLQ